MRELATGNWQLGTLVAQDDGPGQDGQRQQEEAGHLGVVGQGLEPFQAGQAAEHPAGPSAVQGPVHQEVHDAGDGGDGQQQRAEDQGGQVHGPQAVEVELVKAGEIDGDGEGLDGDHQREEHEVHGGAAWGGRLGL